MRLRSLVALVAVAIGTVPPLRVAPRVNSRAQVRPMAKPRNKSCCKESNELATRKGLIMNDLDHAISLQEICKA